MRILLIDDERNDDEQRSIWKLRGLGLQLPVRHEIWTDAHKELTDRHFVLCDSWEIAGPKDLETNPPSLVSLIAQIEEKLRKQINQE